MYHMYVVRYVVRSVGNVDITRNAEYVNMDSLILMLYSITISLYNP